MIKLVLEFYYKLGLLSFVRLSLLLLLFWLYELCFALFILLYLNALYV